MFCIKNSSFFGLIRTFRSSFLIFICLVVAFESSICCVLASDSDSDNLSAGSSEIIGSLSDIEGSSDAQALYFAATGDSEFNASNIVTAWVNYIGCQYFAIKDGDFSQVLENNEFMSSLMANSYVYSDGTYSVNVDFQDLVYSTLLDYMASYDSDHIKSFSPTCPGLPTYSGYFSYLYFCSSTPIYICYDLPAFFLFYSSSAGANVSFSAYGSSFTVIDGASCYNLIGYSSSSSRSRVYSYDPDTLELVSDARDFFISDFYLWNGSPFLAYSSLSWYDYYTSSDSPFYYISGYTATDTVYMTNDGLNYDWAAQNSRNYSALVQAIEDGTLSGQLAINEELSAIAEDMQAILDTLSDISDDVEDIGDDLATTNSLLDDILDVLKSIKRWIVADTLIDFADLLTDIVDLLSDEFNSSGLLEIVSPLTEAMSTKFPLSLPWDIYFIFQMFAVEPETPVFPFKFEFTFRGEVFYSQIYEIDFSDFEIVSDISRSLLTIVFIYGLYSLTIKLVSSGMSD